MSWRGRHTLFALPLFLGACSGGSALAGAVLIMALSVGCGGSGSNTAQVTSGPPREFRAACGHPGATVKVRHVPVTVKHDECDLTGVLIDYRNDTMRVPPVGQA